MRGPVVDQRRVAVSAMIYPRENVEEDVCVVSISHHIRRALRLQDSFVNIGLLQWVDYKYKLSACLVMSAESFGMSL